MASVLLPLPRVAPLAVQEAQGLARLLHAGARIAPFIYEPPREPVEQAVASVHRRFVLEALLALRSGPQGALRANALARAMGVRGQGFANKARALVALGLAERHAGAGAVPAVTYQLTPRGWRVGTLTFALTVYKGAQCRAARAAPPPPPPADVVLDPHARPSRSEVRALWDTLDAEADALADRYMATRPGRAAGPGPGNAAAADVRRFAEMCVRKWHGPVVAALVHGPMRYRDLRAALPVGDEALARALRHLEAVQTVAREGEAYQLTAWGRGTMALGGPMTLAAVQAPHPAAPDP